MVSILRDHIRSSVIAAGEGQDAVGDEGDIELVAVAEAVVNEVWTLWEALARFCRAEMGAAGEGAPSVVPPMQGWIEEALSSADGVQVDADLLLEYETALTNASCEFLPEV